MKIKILVGSALVGEDHRAGLHETVDVPKDRAEYLVSIGAAVKEEDDPEKAKPVVESETRKAPEKKAAAK